MIISEPYLTNLQAHPGKSGILSFVQESNDFPFKIKRIYWIYGVEAGAERGNHAHLNADRIIVCLQGRADVTIESPSGRKWVFTLTTPSQYVFFPRGHWVNITLTPSGILLTLASCIFEEDIVEKDYSKFRQL